MEKGSVEISSASIDDRKRFWTNVSIEKHPRTGFKTGCWIWTAGKGRGYGNFYIKNLKRKVRAHVLSYEMFYGELRKGEVVRHLCRNRACVNSLEHLKAGSTWENVLDQLSSGSLISFGKVVKKKSSKYRGVSFDKSYKKKPWRAYTHSKNRMIRLGRFETEKQAADAVIRYERKG